MIEITTPKIASTCGVRVLSAVRAVLPCGCAAYVGERLDDGEGAVAALACSDEHHALMTTFMALIRASLETPLPVPLVEVCDEMLTIAAGMHA